MLIDSEKVVLAQDRVTVVVCRDHHVTDSADVLYLK